ncbi:hypothetical protein BOX15_Mlig019542g1 [Macrostomum lignano]|nr:hypothetical protein BOX15_Mlig019542g1 [Macrostomum lignano]
MEYILLFPYGEDGWHIGLKDDQHITAMKFYAFMIQVRPGQFNSLLHGRRLFQQYLVDMAAKLESERLNYIRQHQKDLMSERLRGLRDALHADDGDPRDIDLTGVDIGQHVILTSTYVGGPRYRLERQQDAMAYVHAFGRPDLFLTMTCNPKWPEILAELFPGQSAVDRPDITARVFELKKKAFLNRLKSLFGDALARVCSLEYQKRGLPHVHVLLWLAVKLRPDQYDSIISAEIPDPIADADLHKLVVEHMLHGPCGQQLNSTASCMENGKCSKRYPREFLADTIVQEDGYPHYRRRSVEMGGFKATKIAKLREGRRTFEFDNRWVVPYCPALLREFRCHLNVEICATVRAIKYVVKYVMKGSDMAAFQLQKEQASSSKVEQNAAAAGSQTTVPHQAAKEAKKGRDEIKEYLLGRFIGPTEAVNTILGFEVHSRYPAVIRLAVHMPNDQLVYFTPEMAQAVAAQPKPTTLTAFFDLCRQDAVAQGLLYQNVPRHFTWDRQAHQWHRARRGRVTAGQPADVLTTGNIGRVYTVSPRMGQCFYLRLLLVNVPGPTSFESLRTVDGVLLPTFKAACQARGLLEDDNHWRLCLREAAETRMPVALRRLFAAILAHGDPSDPLKLWQEFVKEMAADLLHQGYSTEAAEGSVLRELERLLEVMDGSPLSVYGLPEPPAEPDQHPVSDCLLTPLEAAELQIKVDAQVGMLTVEQRSVFDAVMADWSAKQGGLHFVDAPGGTGKTFLLTLLLQAVRAARQPAIAVASSGIAATILPEGRTAHSMFKIPVCAVRQDNAFCSIGHQSRLAALLRSNRLIVWDEAPMTHRKDLEVFERSLRDLLRVERPFGGALLVMAGDFRQLLAVVPGGTQANSIDACLSRSALWPHFRQHHLSRNLRLEGGSASESYADFLMQVGNGELPEDEEGLIALPSDILLPDDTTTEQLICQVYPSFEASVQRDQMFAERSILAPHNKTVDEANAACLALFPGTSRVYLSVDSIPHDDTAATNFPPELLNRLDPSGLPHHRLELKAGMPVMMMRNIDPPLLCNGTRLLLRDLRDNVLLAEIACGQFRGREVFIPRIPLESNPVEVSIKFRRLQFPIHPCFAMTIHKSQGQSLSTYAVDLTTACFQHGMLYVALSRARSAAGVRVRAPGGRTRNVVLRQLLRRHNSA